MSEALPIRRRWLRMSLRTLLALVTIFGVWLGYQVAAAKRQRNALRVLNDSKNWKIWFSYQRRPLPATSSVFIADPNAVPFAPKWLRDFAGEDLFRDAVAVNLDEPVGSRGVAEFEFATLRELPDLQYLGLRCTRILTNDKSVARRLNDSDLAALSDLKHLRFLDLTDSAIHGSGLAAFRNFKNLKLLILLETHLDDAGMQELGKLTTLESLDLRAADISAESVKYLAGLRELVSLDLSDNGITDKSLEYLKPLKKLKYIGLRSTGVTPAGIEMLKRIFPGITF